MICLERVCLHLFRALETDLSKPRGTTPEHDGVSYKYSPMNETHFVYTFNSQHQFSDVEHC